MMNNNRGFTLVEILAVIVLIGIITVLAVPAINSANAKTKEKILNTKLTTANQALLSWCQDNESCFRSTDAIKCIVGLNRGCTVSGNIVSCSVTMKELADNNIIDYDKVIDGVQTVLNPVDNSSLNSREIKFTYNKDKRTFTFNN